MSWRASGPLRCCTCCGCARPRSARCARTDPTRSRPGSKAPLRQLSLRLEGRRGQSLEEVLVGSIVAECELEAGPLDHGPDGESGPALVGPREPHLDDLPTGNRDEVGAGQLPVEEGEELACQERPELGIGE